SGALGREFESLRAHHTFECIMSSRDDRIGSPETQLKLEFKAAAFASALNRAPSTNSLDEFPAVHAFLSN
ncbi:MAG: hypothetical protein ACLQGT_12180, partial [Terracidiphilus sp.]